jgi:hypothetical protein
LRPYFESAHLDAREYFHAQIGISLHPDAVGGPIPVSYPNCLPSKAGRGNIGRKAFLRENQPELPECIDARFFCGKADLSELPQAYKNAASVRSQINAYGLGEVIDEVIPYGSIMAGDWESDAPWRRGKG